MQKLSKVLCPFMYIKNFIMRNFNSQHSLYDHLPFIKNVTHSVVLCRSEKGSKVIKSVETKENS